MEKRLIICTLIMISIFLFIQFCSALIVSIQPPKKILRMNITNGKLNIFENHVSVKNNNNYSVIITPGISYEFRSIIDIDEESFILQPNESRDIKFTIILVKESNISGDIYATFTGDNMSFPISCSIQIYATKNETVSNNNLPSTPILLSPQNGTKLRDEVVLNWSPSNDPDGDTIAYYYFVDDKESFTEPEYYGVTFKTEKKIKGLKDGKLYYWKVIASDGANNVSSEIWTINTGYNETNRTILEISTPSLISPKNGAKLNYSPVLNWTDVKVNGSVIYNLLIYKRSEIANPFLNITINISHYNTSYENISDDTYFWMVRAGVKDSWSNFSTIWEFTINTTKEGYEENKSKGYCGDGKCDENEDCSSCPNDCECGQSDQTNNKEGSVGGGGYGSPSFGDNYSGFGYSQNEYENGTNQQHNQSKEMEKPLIVVEITEPGEEEGNVSKENDTKKIRVQPTGMFLESSQNLILIILSIFITAITIFFLYKKFIRWL